MERTCGKDKFLCICDSQFPYSSIALSGGWVVNKGEKNATMIWIPYNIIITPNKYFIDDQLLWQFCFDSIQNWRRYSISEVTGATPQPGVMRCLD